MYCLENKKIVLFDFTVLIALPIKRTVLNEGSLKSLMIHNSESDNFVSLDNSKIKLLGLFYKVRNETCP